MKKTIPISNGKTVEVNTSDQALKEHFEGWGYTKIIKSGDVLKLKRITIHKKFKVIGVGFKTSPSSTIKWFGDIQMMKKSVLISAEIYHNFFKKLKYKRRALCPKW